MKVRIGGLEICDLTLDELDAVIRRYAGTEDAQADLIANGAVANVQGGVQGGAADRVVLAKLVEAGLGGVPTNTLGDILGKRGKATRGAVRKWALRIGLTSDQNVDPIEDCRSGTQRGIRLKESFLDVAKHLATQK